DLAGTLRSCSSSLPAPIKAWFEVASAASRGAAITQTRDELSGRMAMQLGTECTDAVTGRYPFTPASTSDVPAADFGRIFGFGGVLDSFFEQNLAALVEVRGGTWRWRDQTNVGMPESLLASFQQAARVREAFFAPGSQMPAVRFSLKPGTVDEAIRQL